MAKIIFIVGLQKSGTTLLNRMLSSLKGVANPFKLEGRNLWGDDPPFTPLKEPCGILYQKHQGTRGHSLTATDFLVQHQNLMRQRISEKKISSNTWVNKNPYNAVRIPWLKKHFPEATIVAMIRNPIANVFSLIKKHHPHESMGFPPDQGWWGVKPINWEVLINENKLIQCAQQWLEVNKQMLENTRFIDHIIKYDDLCKDPKSTLGRICELSEPDQEIINSIGPITCNDNEYLTGSRLLSKNREFVNQNSFQLNTENELIELPAFSAEETETIKSICGDLWSLCQ